MHRSTFAGAARAARAWSMALAAPAVLAAGWAAPSVAADGASGAPAGAIFAGRPYAGATPFIAFVPLEGSGLSEVSTFHFQIQAAWGSVSKPVYVTYSYGYLDRRGYIDHDRGQVTLPVFGLYANADNFVNISYDYRFGGTDGFPLQLRTSAYHDPSGIYDQAHAVHARARGSSIGFDFFYMKSQLGSPVIVDTDGNLRWELPGVPGTMSSTFTDNGFVVGAPQSLQLYRVELDGTSGVASNLQTSDGTNFSHSIDTGRFGLAGEIDVTVGGQTQLRSTAVEFDPFSGQDAHEWNFVQILSDYMRGHGDDPSLFVRPQTDWFHMNMVTYDPSDNSLIVSSRENFVMKVDYDSGEIKWILGDTTKYWYTFASLRALSLTLQSGGLAPIGQHATTIAPDGNLLLFNNGTPSFNMPKGQPAGQKRNYSTVTAYSIDAGARTARQVWNFDYGRSLRSPLCSSARQVSDGSVLIDYAQTDNKTTTHIVGLDPAHAVVFDYSYRNPNACNTSWNAQPIALDQLTFQ